MRAGHRHRRWPLVRNVAVATRTRTSHRSASRIGVRPDVELDSLLSRTGSLRPTSMRHTLWFLSVVLVVSVFAVSMSGQAAIVRMPPGPEACTALGAEKFAALATMTAT